MDEAEDLLRSLQAIQLGHVEVHDYELVHGFAPLPAILNLIYSLFAVTHKTELELVLLEDADEGVGAIDVVFDDKDVRHIVSTMLIILT